VRGGSGDGVPAGVVPGLGEARRAVDAARAVDGFVLLLDDLVVRVAHGLDAVAERRRRGRGGLPAGEVHLDALLLLNTSPLEILPK